MRLNCYILAFLLQKQIRETTDEDSDESDTEDGRKVSIVFVYRKSVVTKLVGNILGPTVSSKTGEICTSVRNGTKAHFMCFLLIYQEGEFLSSDNLNLKCIVCEREKKLCAKIYLSIARWISHYF